MDTITCLKCKCKPVCIVYKRIAYETLNELAEGKFIIKDGNMGNTAKKIYKVIANDCLAYLFDNN